MTLRVSPETSCGTMSPLFLYQKKVKGKASSAVYGLLPHDVAEELRNVPSNAYTPEPFLLEWSQ